jgi:hypothetical protein
VTFLSGSLPLWTPSSLDPFLSGPLPLWTPSSLDLGVLEASQLHGSQALLGVPDDFRSPERGPSTGQEAQGKGPPARPSSADDARRREVGRDAQWEPDEASLEDLGQYKVKMQQHALSVCMETLGSDHPYTAMEVPTNQGQG